MNHHSSIPALVFVGFMVWIVASPLLALAFAWVLGKLDTPDPFRWCSPLSFRGLDEQ
jgi:hypothetical protein